MDFFKPSELALANVMTKYSKTVLVNKTKDSIRIASGNAGVYKEDAVLCPGDEYTIIVNLSFTYSQYLFSSISGDRRLLLSQEEFDEFSKMEVFLTDNGLECKGVEVRMVERGTIRRLSGLFDKLLKWSGLSNS